jgi:hypothetical protein
MHNGGISGAPRNSPNVLSPLAPLKIISNLSLSKLNVLPAFMARIKDEIQKSRVRASHTSINNVLEFVNQVGRAALFHFHASFRGRAAAFLRDARNRSPDHRLDNAIPPPRDYHPPRSALLPPPPTHTRAHTNTHAYTRARAPRSDLIMSFDGRLRLIE